jgi:hypothetical protein
MMARWWSHWTDCAGTVASVDEIGVYIENEIVVLLGTLLAVKIGAHRAIVVA